MTLAHCRKKASFFDVSDSKSDVSEKCAYGWHSPSDALERVRRVEVLGLATLQGWGCWGWRRFHPSQCQVPICSQ